MILHILQYHLKHRVAVLLDLRPVFLTADKRKRIQKNRFRQKIGIFLIKARDCRKPKLRNPIKSAVNRRFDGNPQSFKYPRDTRTEEADIKIAKRPIALKLIRISGKRKKQISNLNPVRPSTCFQGCRPTGHKKQIVDRSQKRLFQAVMFGFISLSATYHDFLPPFSNFSSAILASCWISSISVLS